MSPGRRCGSGSAGRRLQVLVQHGDPLREQRIHIERELHGPLCGIGHAPQNVTSATRAGKPLSPRPAPRIRPAPTVESSARETPFFLLGQLFSSNRAPFVGLWPCGAMATKHPALPVNSRGNLQKSQSHTLSLMELRALAGRPHSHPTAAPHLTDFTPMFYTVSPKEVRNGER